MQWLALSDYLFGIKILVTQVAVNAAARLKQLFREGGFELIPGQPKEQGAYYIGVWKNIQQTKCDRSGSHAAGQAGERGWLTLNMQPANDQSKAV